MKRMASADFQASAGHADMGIEAGFGIQGDADAYRQFDGCLDSLHRDYLNARAVHEQLMRLYGIGDAMTQIASDRMESCLCAFDMRLIELRRSNILKQAALARLKVMRLDMERREADKQRADRAYKKRCEDYYAADMDTKRVRERRADEESFANFLIVWHLMRQTAGYATHRLRIANMFAQASLPGTRARLSA
jgi:hypothetical protein